MIILEKEKDDLVNLKKIMPYFLDNDFYKNKLIGFNCSNFNLKDFENIPFTTKNELRKTLPLQRSTVDRKDIAYFFSSSGTTGHPTAYVWTKNDDKILNIVSKRAMNRVGVNEEDIALIIAPFGMPIMWYCMLKQYASLNAGVISLGITNPNYILDTIHEFEPSIVTTVPNSILSLYEFKENVYKNKFDHSIKQFHVGGDFLSHSRRSRIEEKWNAECFDFYGLSEIMGPIAGECLNKNGLHFSSDYIYIEIIDPITKKKVKNGETGIAVYTTLWEKGAPLLRYWSDDFVSLDLIVCSCGCNYPKIHYKGRVQDSILLNEKRIFAKELEDVILMSGDIGNEWQLEVSKYTNKPKGILTVEANASSNFIAEQISRIVSDFAHLKIEVNVVPLGHFLRSQVKPKRIVQIYE